ncbi:TRAP transporter substrate-binding protein [Plastoroseomonas arctica]|uniref:TRAP transporter substrate-binding protein n=1 Tax=Plastoroseomonas arctica TaxID=1509237 RepID=A0AAF1JY51_9PROT|nr:TRAP transporter substrate-binding protein [Plastoroseomonas arctica]MBR0656477.1 TRAP transporter substrate-binding protein [Plastoroseomonas arctica]
MTSPAIARRTLVRASALAPLALPWIGGRVSAQTITLRSADTHPDGYPTVEAVKFMGRLVEERSAGRLRIQLFHSRQLGEERETLEQTRFGVIDLNRVNFGPLNNLVPETVVPGLPFVFRDEAHMRRVMDGTIGDEIIAGADRHGFVGLCYYDSGARSFYTRGRAARTPEDMRGLKIRVQQSDLWVAIMRAVGANATPLPFGEVYSALQTGVVDGAENNWPSYHSTRHFEVAKHYCVTEHSMSPEILVASKRSFDRLPRDLQGILRQAAKESVGEMRRLWDAQTEASKQAVTAGGSLVNDVDKEAFARAMAPVYDQFARDPRMRALVNRIREAA